MASLRAIEGAKLKIAVKADGAGRRMQRWRAQPPFSAGSYFAQRLAMDGMSEAEFLYILGEPIEAVHGRFPVPPAWLAELAQAFSRPAASSAILLSAPVRSQEVVGFLSLIEPLISQGRDRLHQGVQAVIQAQADLPFDPRMIEDVLFTNLPPWLLEMLSRTMVLELHVARLQGVLKGETPEARFCSFVQRLHQREIALAILQEYPVLARQLTMCINHWVAYNLEFLQHLCTDWQAIRATFSPEHDPGVLVQIAPVSHEYRGGRSVKIARFSSGLQVVYKPRSLALDVHFQELLAWINDQGADPPFRTLKLLDRGTYGWVEFVVAQGCPSSNEVQRFYKRQGGYLALLYALEAIDLHFENLIAVGEHPMLIDLEALFHPRIGRNDPEQVDQLASKTLSSSILRIRLLPQRMWSSAESDGVDVSGLGAVAGQPLPYEVPHWEGFGTDAMRLTHTRAVMAGGQHRPRLNGTEVDVLDYTEAITAGFTHIYHLLLQHRDVLLADDGPIARFAKDEVRAFLRPTQVYDVLLRGSYHPDVLRDAMDRDRLFDKLWAAVPHLPSLARVIPAEREDLQQGSIPRLTTRPGARELWSSSHERIVDFFDEPSLTLVRRRLEHLCVDDLVRQLWFIRASLATLTMDANQAQQPTYYLGKPLVIADRERLLTAARAVGDRLEALVLRDEHEGAWIGLTHTNERYWSIAPLGMDLYDGLPGLALFLAYLGSITQEDRYTVLAHYTLITLRRQVERCRSCITSIGGFTGWGGLIYTLTHLGALWNEPALLAEAEAIVEHLPALIEQDDLLDITAGAAGCIESLLSLYQCIPSDRTLAVAIQCGERLMARAQPMAQGLGWVIAAAGPTPLTGFSHGATGIAWALLELAALTGEEQFRAAACAAIAYERSLFSPEAGNWPDLRERQTSRQTGDNGQQRFMTAWCHGAPGIGLARLCSLRHLDDAAVRAEIDAALRTTLAQGFGGNHSLCHGDLGTLKLLLQASQILEAPQWRAQVDRIAAIILESISRDGWLCGTPLGVESPGLMTGLAGIGYGLLRLAEPTRVPSVLVLEPPARHESC
jgi:type 2 lantibiotic biosynthesis protein LanM